jgi:cytochrome c
VAGFGVLIFLVAASSLARADDRPRPTGPQTDGVFRKVIIDAGGDIQIDGALRDSLKDPMQLALAADGRLFYIERGGHIKMWSPKKSSTLLVGEIAVEDYEKTKMEDGLLGIILDPNFITNGWLYLYYSPPESTLSTNGESIGENVLSRFSFADDRIDAASEKVLLRVPTQRQYCCHSGGGLAFDAHGNLFLATGDNTAPLASDGYTPIDERPGHEAFDAQKSAGNANDLRGKILRVTPQADGTIKIPKGNLFPPGTPGTRPEIYAMGCRNPFRFSVDQKTGYVYWGDVGPDAMAFQSGRGPPGLDEVNQARKAGNFGWPYFEGDNKPYWKYDFATKTSGEQFDPAHPVNRSPNNTGITELPPAQPALLFYPYSLSARFPVVNGGGGRTIMAGPVYYFHKRNPFRRKFPREYDHTLFIYEWSRNWIVAIHLDAHEKFKSMERFCPNMTFHRPMDMELGPDGCLYLIEWGSAWGNNLDTQIERIEFVGEGK